MKEDLKRLIISAVILFAFSAGLIGLVRCLPSKAPANQLPDLIESVRGSVVHVSKPGQRQGSGCLISADGIIFTAKHLSDGEYGDYEITLDDGRKFKIKPGYVLEDKENDITFMQLDLDGQEPNLPYSPLVPDGKLRIGERVLVMGSPLGSKNFNSVSDGMLVASDRNLYDRPGYGWAAGRPYNWRVMLQHTAVTEGGSSGGPVFNMSGEVIGVHVAAEGSTKFAVPVARFRDTIDAVRDHFRLCRFNVIGEPEQEPDYNELYRNFQDWCLSSN